MATNKQTKGGRALAALNAATEPVATETVQLLRINGELRLFLTVAEVADLCGVDKGRVLKWIEDGTIHHARQALGTKFYPIPVRELVKLQSYATDTGHWDGINP